MLHLLFEPGAWFRPKRFGYGAGLPIAWQGWVLLIAYAAAVAGLAWLAQGTDRASQAGLAALILVLTAGFIAIVKARTRGEWRWRWGDDS